MATRKKTPPARQKKEPPTAGRESDGGVDFNQIKDLQVTFTMHLGRTRQTLEDVVQIGEQSLIELDKKVGDPIDVLVNGRLFARGEVVTIDETYGVKITEIIRPVD
jgi:flagellar motor switch protein FliN